MDFQTQPLRSLPVISHVPCLLNPNNILIGGTPGRLCRHAQNIPVHLRAACGVSQARADAAGHAFLQEIWHSTPRALLQPQRPPSQRGVGPQAKKDIKIEVLQAIRHQAVEPACCRRRSLCALTAVGRGNPSKITASRLRKWSTAVAFFFQMLSTPPKRWTPISAAHNYRLAEQSPKTKPCRAAPGCRGLPPLPVP